MTSSPFPHCRSKSCHGSALITVLAGVVILSILLLSFLISMQLDRQSTLNYSQSIKAQEIARGAGTEVLSDLLQEIDAGSLPDGSPAGATYTVNGVRIYIPTTNHAMLPARVGFAAGAYGTNPADLPLNLLRVSRASDPFYASPPAWYDATKLPPNRASAVSSAAASANRRLFAASRWNKPLLMGTSLPAAFSNSPPDWIYVTRAGSRVCDPVELPTLKPSGDIGQTNQIVGRYAFVIYEQGGLLDINSAGYHTSALAESLSQNARTFSGTSIIGGKTYAAFADLTRLPGLSTNQAGIDSLIAWRNKGLLAQQGGKYLPAALARGREGFLKFQSGDSPLLGRQDMIDYFKTTGWLGTNLGALQYLTTFNRSLNAPSWRPTASAPNVNYAARAEDGASENRDLPNVRETSGHPLLKQRFPLSRLALLATPGQNAAAVREFFGLTWDNVQLRWVYEHGDPHAVKTLEEVRAEGRQPDFFELLKAAILDGSLGKDPGSSTNPRRAWAEVEWWPVEGPMGMHFSTYSAEPAAQIIQLGANIIDQYDTDSYPTAIYFANPLNPDPNSQYLNAIFNTHWGIESLPYLSSLRLLRWRDGAANLPNGEHHGWFQPALWNPHQLGPPPGSRPTKFRVRAYGRSEIRDWAHAIPTVTSFEPSPTSAGDQFLHFTDAGDATSPFYDKPLFLTTTQADSAFPNTANNVWQDRYGNNSAVGGRFMAFYAGKFKAEEVREDNDGNSNMDDNGNGTPNEHISWGSGFIIGANDPASLTFVLEYQDPSGRWLPYSRLARFNAFSGLGWPGPPENSPDIAVLGNADISRVDPRTDRFSVSLGWPGLADPTQGNTTYWPKNSVVHSAAYFLPTGNFAGGSRLGLYSVNQTNSAHYQDPDGVVRPGDGYRGNDTTRDGRPLFVNPVASDRSAPRHPVVLNRPFRSVGELGYVFRDLPFKSLDFWSKESADAGLLDVFCLTEEPAVVSGQINPNTAPAPVLEAMLAGASKKETDASLNITGASGAVAARIVEYLKNHGPLGNRSDLVTHASGTANLSDTINGTFSATADKANKAYGETVARALSSVSNTRTWNLLIDIVAQAGRLSPQAATLTDFVVEGEKRYWLHVAIDRFTGEIVDQQWEPVYE